MVWNFFLFLTVFDALALATLPIVDLGYERHQSVSFNVRILLHCRYANVIPMTP